MTHNIIAITSGIGVGKSTLLMKIAQHLQESNKLSSRGHHLIGFIQLARYDDQTSEQMGYDLILLEPCTKKQQRVSLLSKNPAFDTRAPVGPTNRRWIFHESAFQIAHDHVRNLVKSVTSTDDQSEMLFIVDELGWKEAGQEGHWPLIQEIFTSGTKQNTTWLMAIREGLLDTFMNKFRQANPDTKLVLAIHLSDNSNLEYHESTIMTSLSSISP